MDYTGRVLPKTWRRIGHMRHFGALGHYLDVAQCAARDVFALFLAHEFPDLRVERLRDLEVCQVARMREHDAPGTGDSRLDRSHMTVHVRDVGFARNEKGRYLYLREASKRGL